MLTLSSGVDRDIQSIISMDLGSVSVRRDLNSIRQRSLLLKAKVYNELFATASRRNHTLKAAQSRAKTDIGISSVGMD